MPIFLYVRFTCMLVCGFTMHVYGFASLFLEPGMFIISNDVRCNSEPHTSIVQLHTSIVSRHYTCVWLPTSQIGKHFVGKHPFLKLFRFSRSWSLAELPQKHPFLLDIQNDDEYPTWQAVTATYIAWGAALPNYIQYIVASVLCWKSKD
jgi:hypothetical protein